MPKDCLMEEALERAIVAKVLKADFTVPPFPSSAAKLDRVLKRERYALSEVVEVLRTDDVLAATTLRVANSPHFRGVQPSTTLSDATVRIGPRNLYRLSVAAGATTAFGSQGKLQPLRQKALRQALLAAVICEQLASTARVPTEQAFLAGLLHDIGRVLTITVLEELGETKDLDRCWLLTDRFHVEHGMVVAARWRMPAELEQVIADHHVRDARADEPVLRFVQAADRLIALLDRVPAVSAEALETVEGLTAAERKALLVALPLMPEYVEAYGVNGAPGAAQAGAPAPAGPQTGVPLELHAVGPVPVRGLLTDGCDTALSVHAQVTGRANWLAQVKVEGLTFWATVVGVREVAGRGFRWELRPFALSPDVAAAWAQLTGRLAA